MKPAIEVNGLSKSYLINHKNKASYNTIKDDFGRLIKHPFRRDATADKQETFWALKDVSFTVNPGEIFGIVGRNGSGKSTMLKILSRIVEPTRGNAILRGRTASLLEVGTGFNPELTGRENVYFNGSMLGMSKREIRKKFDEIVAFSEVEKFLDTPVKFYSSGMYVRLAFSVAAHLEPDILILDEVLAVGDAGFQKKSLSKILSTMEEGRTVLFVSHSMGAIQQLCSRGILLKEGQIAFEGPVGKLTEEYMAVIRNETSSRELATQWKNDGSTDNDYFVPQEIFLTDSHDSKVTKPVPNNEHYFVNIVANIKKSSDLLTMGYGIYNEQRTLMYMTNQADSSKGKITPLPNGKVVMRCKVPAHFLNAGAYQISLLGGIHNKFWLFEPGTKTPTIELSIAGGLSESPYWTQPREGLMAPVLDWSIEKL